MICFLRNSTLNSRSSVAQNTFDIADAVHRHDLVELSCRSNCRSISVTHVEIFHRQISRNVVTGICSSSAKSCSRFSPRSFPMLKLLRQSPLLSSFEFTQTVSRKLVGLSLRDLLLTSKDSAAKVVCHKEAQKAQRSGFAGGGEGADVGAVADEVFVVCGARDENGAAFERGVRDEGTLED